MQDAIKNFSKQFEYEPAIENESGLVRHKTIIIAGMGGSHLAADILKSLRPDLDIVIHSDYGLPLWSPEQLAQSMVVASSYSGNTEETIDAFETAYKNNISVVAIAVGGKLLEMARAKNTPRIQLPDTGIQPRMAVGLSLRAMLAAIGENKLLEETKMLAQSLAPEALKEQGIRLATTLQGKIPIIYASHHNKAVALNWKIIFNENTKIHAFFNVFPEFNHNEMTGFDVVDATRELSKNFLCIMLRDTDDHPKIQKRMDSTESLLSEKGISTLRVALTGSSRPEKIFSSLILANWTAASLAAYYGLDHEPVPMVEEFKKLIA